MDAAQFWQIIEHSRHDDAAKQKTRLRAKLRPLPDDDIASFAAWLRKAVEEIHTPALAAAAQIVLGGISDDSYEYFRLWLISRGPEASLRVLRDPNDLIELLDDPDEASFEEFASPALGLLEKRVGEEGAWELVDETRQRLASEHAFDKTQRKGFAERKHDLARLAQRIEGDAELQARRKQAAREAEQYAKDAQIEVTAAGARVGHRVRHPHYGEGVLLSAELHGNVELCLVHFDNGHQGGFVAEHVNQDGVREVFLSPVD